MTYWNTSAFFFLPRSHDKLITWFVIIIIAAFCGANFVYDENNSMFSSVILPTDRCISYRFLLIRNRIQMK